ncbi:transporter (NhaC family) [Mesocricetibacter intestinalis]|uniref:Transporter (NhaC family) n=1 Tax=Mesocricetibacter intestinalis TaxID=1521930 RepID=A0A4R6VAP9_9PAST|nr:Na+/H+ antiporter NhaC family protein [Mesocricetibacter intestinalis]TDQ57344.1 transporter (NhaC family) [Mesocricetibacter intestinalis]
MQLVDFSTSAWSVLPAILALALAIVSRKVILSLSIGILVGAIMLSDGNIGTGLQYLYDRVTSLIYTFDESGQWVLNDNNTNIIFFLLLLGILTAFLSVSGSNQAFVEWAQRHIKSRRGAKLMAACLVFVTFIDDYFHSLAVGAIARPVTDKFKVSRAKLAYILDSTAAPMCVLMPMSSWGAYIMTLIAGLLAEHGIREYSPIGAFITISSMNFYAIFSIVTVFVIAIFSFDIGPMARHERQAMAKEENECDEEGAVKGKVRNLVLPILALIVSTVAMMMYTGNQALAAEGKAFSVLGAFENTTVGLSLVVGGLTSIAVSSLLIVAGRQVSLSEYLRAIILGMKSMLGAILILFFAWTINKVVSDMQAGQYLAGLISSNLAAGLLPALLFLLGTVMAFSTGTSWGTFGIMLPIAAAIAVNAAPELLIPCLSAVMAGAVCGDHCSPVSDTTILSASGAKCNHMDHVTTQLPYALLVALSTTVGYLTVGFTQSGLLGFVATAAVLALILLIGKKRI